MDFELTDEQLALQQAASQYARANFRTDGGISDVVAFDRSAARSIAELGYVGIDFPETDGGQGGTLLDALIVLQAITYESPRAGDVVQAFNFGGIRQLQHLAGADLRQTWLAPALKGDALISVAMTEPDVGSDLASMRTRIEYNGSTATVTGTKVFSTHGVDADLLIVWGRFSASPDGIGAVAIPTDTPGFSRGSTERFMSGESYCTMYLDRCQVPGRNILTDSRAFRTMMPIFNIERLGNAARCIAVAESAFDRAVSYSSERMIKDQPLSSMQGIRWKFADMKMRLVTAKLALYQAAEIAERAKSDGARAAELASSTALAKCVANEASFFIVNEALQIFGAYGYSREYPLEYYLRRVRGWMIAGGSVEVLRNRIAKDILRAN